MLLDNFPKILWINLYRSQKRREYMESLLNKHNLINTRISAVDGKAILDRLSSKHIYDKEFNEICIQNIKWTSVENACTCSHIKALKYFVDNIPDDKVIIFEDDISFEFLKLIPFNWSELEANFPENFDVIQLAITYEKGSIGNLLIKTNPSMNYFCSAAYLVTKTGAKKLVEKYYNSDVNKIDLSTKEFVTADSMISSTGHTYSIPIFTYQTTESTIHPRHLYNHSRTKTQQYKLWKSIDDHPELFNKADYFAKFEKN